MSALAGAPSLGEGQGRRLPAGGGGRLAPQRGSQRDVAQMRGALQLCSGITRYFVSSPRQMGGATWSPLCGSSTARGRHCLLGAQTKAAACPKQEATSPKTRLKRTQRSYRRSPDIHRRCLMSDSAVPTPPTDGGNSNISALCVS